MHAVIWGGLIVFVILVLLLLGRSNCAMCEEPSVNCPTCKHYKPMKKISYYEPAEEPSEVSDLAERIKKLSDEDFIKLGALVRRGYEDGKD